MLNLQLFQRTALTDERDGTSIPLRPWYVSLLSCLALSPGPGVSRSALVGLLWPESPEKAARLRLRQLLFRLRRDLGEVVLSEGELLRLDPAGVRADAVTFQRLVLEGERTEAMELYRGELLEGDSLPGGAALQQLVDGERARLRDLACSTCQELVEAGITAGDRAAALGWAERWCALAPFSEAAIGRCITLEAQLGDRGGALARFDRFRERLREALDVAPGADLLSLVERIRSTVPPFPEAERRPSVSPAEAPFVGRTAEIARLRRRWDQARAGRRQLVLLSGEPGIGKSRLARELLEWTRLEGATVLAGRAYEVEQGIPYAALAGALRGVLDAPGLAAVDAASLQAVGAVVPQLRSRFGGPGDAAVPDMESGRLRIMDGVRAILDNLAYEAPVVLFLDDLPWADEATLAVLHYLWRTLPGAPLLLLATARSGDLLLDGPVGKLVISLRRVAGEELEEIDLAPLGSGDLSRLAASLGVTPQGAEMDRLERDTGGNPLFAVEALRARGELAVPSARTELIRTAVRDRIVGLSPAGSALLSAAAVLGRRFPLPTAASVASLDSTTAVDAVEELLRGRLIRQVEYEYDFAHDLLRQIVCADMHGERRRMLHRRAFERLRPCEGEAVGLERAGALVTHARLGGLTHEARRWALEAATLAEQVYAGAEAERFLEQAAECAAGDAEQEEVWERIGDLRRLRSRFAAAATAYLCALRQGRGSTAERLRVRIKLLDVSLRSGLLDLRAARGAVADLHADVRDRGDVHVRDLHSVLAHAHAREGALPRAGEHARRALEVARAIADPQDLVGALLLHARLVAAYRSPTDALPFVEEAIAAAGAAGLGRELGAARIELGILLYRLGRWTEAEARWRAILLDAEAEGPTVRTAGTVAIASIDLADLLIRRGERAEAESALVRAEELAGRFDWPHLRVDVLLNRLLLAWYSDDARLACDASRVIEEAERLEIRPVARVARALLVLGLVAEGRVAEADREVEPLEASSGSRHLLWREDQELIALARSRVKRAGGSPDAAAEILRTACREATDPYSAAMLRLEMARHAVESEPTLARHLAEEAAEVFRRLAADPMLRRARDLVSRLELRP